MLCDTAVVGEGLELDEVVAVILELKEVVADGLVLCDALVVRLVEGEVVIACPAPTATNAIFADWYQNVTSGGFVSATE